MNVDAVTPQPKITWRERMWREWCFVRLVGRHFSPRLLVMIGVLVGGGLLFKHYEPEKNHSLARATYYTWCLIFGEPPEEFPTSWVLQALFFVIPVLGLTVIIQAIVKRGSTSRGGQLWIVDQENPSASTPLLSRIQS